MAKLWLIYREGLRDLGRVVANVPLEPTISKLDIAPWRLFNTTPPDEVPASRIHAARVRTRALLEVRDADRGELCGFGTGFFESPYSPAECLRRLGLTDEAQPSESEVARSSQ